MIIPIRQSAYTGRKPTESTVKCSSRLGDEDSENVSVV
jgi:hypothetical protein